MADKNYEQLGTDLANYNREQLQAIVKIAEDGGLDGTGLLLARTVLATKGTRRERKPKADAKKKAA